MPRSYTPKLLKATKGYIMTSSSSRLPTKDIHISSIKSDEESLPKGRTVSKQSKQVSPVHQSPGPGPYSPERIKVKTRSPIAKIPKATRPELGSRDRTPTGSRYLKHK